MWRRAIELRSLDGVPSTKERLPVLSRSMGKARPTNLRILSALVAGTFTVSGCMTTVAVSPASVAASAGLPEGKESKLRSSEGWETVNGSTQITLRSTEDETATVNEAPLSALRSEGRALVLPGDSHRLALDNIWSAEITKPAPGQTVGLVAGIVLGTAALGVAVYFVAEWISFVNTCNNLFSDQAESRARIHR